MKELKVMMDYSAIPLWLDGKNIEYEDIDLPIELQYKMETLRGVWECVMRDEHLPCPPKNYTGVYLKALDDAVRYLVIEIKKLYPQYKVSGYSEILKGYFTYG